MRLFTAVDLPQDLLETLERLVERLRPHARLSWSPTANFHITTKFLGEWPDERLGEVEGALRMLPAHPPIPIRVHGLGFFPHARSPRVFWAGVEVSEALESLARETDRSLARLGVPSESRPFSPHLTLARVRDTRVSLGRLHQEIAHLPSVEFGSFTADRFYLYQSRLAPGGSVYTRLSEHPFAK